MCNSIERFNKELQETLIQIIFVKTLNTQKNPNSNQHLHKQSIFFVSLSRRNKIIFLPTEEKKFGEIALDLVQKATKKASGTSSNPTDLKRPA